MKKIALLIVCMIVLLTACGIAEQAVEGESEPTVTVVVNEKSRTAEDQWDEIAEGYELAVVNITVTNNTSENYDFNPNYITIQYDGQTEFVSDKKPAGEDVLNGFIIKPEESITGILCYDIPIGTEYEVVFDGEVIG